MSTTKKAVFTAVLLAAAAYTPSSQASWFWPFIVGTGARVAAGTAARAAVGTVARTVATSTARKAALGAAAAGIAAGYVVGAEASEEKDVAAENRKYCLNQGKVYFVPQWASNCLDGAQPQTEVADLTATLGE